MECAQQCLLCLCLPLHLGFVLIGNVVLILMQSLYVHEASLILNRISICSFCLIRILSRCCAQRRLCLGALVHWRLLWDIVVVVDRLRP